MYCITGTVAILSPETLCYSNTGDTGTNSNYTPDIHQTREKKYSYSPVDSSRSDEDLPQSVVYYN